MRVRNALSARHTVHKLPDRGIRTTCGLYTGRPSRNGTWHFTNGAQRPLCRKCFKGNP